MLLPLHKAQAAASSSSPEEAECLSRGVSIKGDKSVPKEVFRYFYKLLIRVMLELRYGSARVIQEANGSLLSFWSLVAGKKI